MSLAGLRTQVRRLREAAASRLSPPENPTLSRLRADPTLPFRAMGLTPDPWQVGFLTSPSRRESLLCSRQAGKSMVTAARVIRDALLTAGDYLVFCPTMRQSMELVRKARQFYEALGRPVRRTGETKTSLELANGSRVLSLPDFGSGVVGFSAPRLIVIDEAARVSDELYRSVRPMLATSGGALLTLSTPFGQHGWFHDIWDDSAAGKARRAKLNEPWRRTRVTADAVPRITKAFLADERVELGERWFRQEYYLEFTDAIDAVFRRDVIDGGRRTGGDDGIVPLFDMGA